VSGFSRTVLVLRYDRSTLKLESSRAMLETLIIDRFERPTEN
jgi:hypothetical protein